MRCEKLLQEIAICVIILKNENFLVGGYPWLFHIINFGNC